MEYGGNSLFLTQHDVEVRILVRGFFFVTSERKCQRQRADTTAIHVDGQDQFRHPVPVGAFAGGEAACGECRGGFEQGGQQLHIGLHHREQEAGNGFSLLPRYRQFAIAKSDKKEWNRVL